MTKKMTETDVLKAMNGFPEEWLESCCETKGASVTGETMEKSGTDIRTMRFGKNAVKWAVAATLALLLCGGGVDYVAKLGILQFSKVDDKENYGFSLHTETARISAEELTGPIREVEGFLRDYMAEEDEIYINETVAVFTQESPISLQGTGIRHSKEFLEEVQSESDYRSKEYITASGKTAVFVYEEKVDGNLWLMGALVDGAVYYELSILYYSQDLERAEEILIQWCEQF